MRGDGVRIADCDCWDSGAWSLRLDGNDKTEDRERARPGNKCVYLKKERKLTSSIQHLWDRIQKESYLLRHSSIARADVRIQKNRSNDPRAGTARDRLCCHKDENWPVRVLPAHRSSIVCRITRAFVTHVSPLTKFIWIYSSAKRASPIE
jgi:hypothetical protein